MKNGGIESTTKSYRERSMFAPMEATVQDLRHAVRTLQRDPGFSATSAVTLALAIGAGVAMFSVLDAVLLRPLPFRMPEQLAMLWTEIPSQSVSEGRAAYWTAEQWRRNSRSFAGMAVLDPVSATLTHAGEAERIGVARVSPNLFPLLGVQPVRGRVFSEEEAGRRQRVAVISHRFWQARFGGRPEAIGAAVEIDGARTWVIGVLPAEFRFPNLDADLWEPHTAFPDWETRRSQRGAGSWLVVGRLRPDVTFKQAQAEMSALAPRLDEQSPASERGRGISVVPLALQATGSRSRLALWMLSGAVVCVLLIAAANVAGLSLARNVARGREMAIRTALGASRTRIVRQLLAESLTLTVLSGALGLLVAYGGIRIVQVFEPGGLARLGEAGLDWRALGSALALCVLTTVLVGLAPALAAGGRDTDLGGRSIAGGLAARRARRVLVVTEFALAVMMLVSAGLLIRSLRSVENVEPGFRARRILSAQLSAPANTAAASRAGLFQQILEEIESLPGVESAAVIENFFIGGAPEQRISVDGAGGTAPQHLRSRTDAVSGGFFRTLGASLLRGRFFEAGDGSGALPVAIVNDALARRLWPTIDPVGRRFKFGGGEWLTVVGVVGDMRRQGLETVPIPQVFRPLAQDPPRLTTLLVRVAARDPLTMAGAVQAAVRRVDKRVPFYGVATLESRLGGFLAHRRFQTWLLIAFAAVALVMAATGIYGLIRYSVATRVHEIGIRLAVGAGAGDVFRMVLGEGLKLSFSGLALGLAGALCLGRAGSSLLFGVGAADSLTFLSVSLLLTAVAAAACWFPARRAAKIDPVVALRRE